MDSPILPLTIRRATRQDVPVIVRLLASDPLGSQREQATDPLPEAYYCAFEEIACSPRDELVVVEFAGQIVGTLHLSYLTYLSFQGGKRLQVESVHIDERFRNQGIGRQVMVWAIERARQEGCVQVQLTSHASRVDAHRFYEQLGFSVSHLGMKLRLR